MSDAASQLLSGILDRLASDTVLVDRLGGHIHDAPGRGGRFPVLVVEDIETKDLSGLDAPLEEHRITLTVQARAGGKREALDLAALAEAALGVPPALPGHAVILLSVESRDCVLLRDRLTAEATLTLKALTEPL